MTAALQVPETRQALIDQMAECAVCPEHFIDQWCQIKDDQVWKPFRLWDAQRTALQGWYEGDRHAALKSRQVGLSWLALAWAMWHLLFRPGSTVLLLSLREEEAVALLERLRGMLRRLPDFLRPGVETDRATFLRLASGSSVRALPSHRGDSYNASLVIVDEAALIPRLGQLLGSLEPTVADGGQILLVSRANKRDPSGTFARICRSGLEGDSPWSVAFLPWNVHPGRDADWYARQVEASLASTGGLDAVHEQYPATPEEALAPAALGKRLPHTHLLPCYTPTTTLADDDLPADAPAFDGLRVYRLPEPGRKYVAGADPAEGLPGAERDDSVLVVVDKDTGEEVACAYGRWSPGDEFAAHIDRVCRWYNGADVLVERNNHGHTTLAALSGRSTHTLSGPDRRPGYSKTKPSKDQLWDTAWEEIVDRARAINEAEIEGAAPPPPLIRDRKTYNQLASLESSTCKAPPGEHDDGADAWGLAQKARTTPPPSINVY